MIVITDGVTYRNVSCFKVTKNKVKLTMPVPNCHGYFYRMTAPIVNMEVYDNVSSLRREEEDGHADRPHA